MTTGTLTERPGSDRLTSYHDTTDLSRTEDRNSVNLDSYSGEAGGMGSSGNKVRSRRKCVWITSIIAGLIAITIIAVTIKSRFE